MHLPQAAEPIQDIDFSSFLAQADQVILAVVIILVLMSIATWYLALTKGLRTWRLRRRADKVVRQFWSAHGLAQALSALGDDDDPFTSLVRQGARADAHHREYGGNKTLGEACTRSEFITRSLRQVIATETSRIESGLTVLASVGSTAPFVGLFGTVWGIYHALIKMGATGHATIDQVAGPVGEALIMTAFGLAVAIPAVLIYNAFVRANRVFLSGLDAFAHDLHAYFTTGVRLASDENGQTDAATAGSATQQTQEITA